MKLHLVSLAVVLAVQCALAAPFSTNANRLTHLDSGDPFQAGLHYPKLTTPQWVGEQGVDAVVILAIDDMRESAKYEAVLRPVLNRLKKIDGRAPASIMVNTIAPTDENLQPWLAEGVSLECHTLAHPCPICQNKNFDGAAATYHGCVEALSAIPGNRPVAFRVPCCDSMNSPSPRFYSEIFARTTARGAFLSIDSSVMVMLTTIDTTVPRQFVTEADGSERFRKYLPMRTNALTRVSMESFTTTIEDYPYPYVIGKTIWEFPCIVPSDWEANNAHGPNNPRTVEDWKRALDAIVFKQGVMTFIFHPHGWIQPTQMVDFVDYATTKYGKRVKFMNFKEAQERLQRNLCSGEPLRRTDDGGDNGVRLFDVNNDGYMDVTLGFQNRRVTRIWSSATKSWRETECPFAIIEAGADGKRIETPVKFGVVHEDGSTIAIDAANKSAWHFANGRWTKDDSLSAGLELEPTRVATRVDAGLRLRDVDGNGRCEFIVGNDKQNAIFQWVELEKRWKPAAFALPQRTSIVDAEGRDAGLRFVDVDGDGFDDVIFSNYERYSLHLFRKDSRNLRLKPGWTDEVLSGARKSMLDDAIPPIVRDGANRNNGVWFSRGMMWIQNEDTSHLPDKVDRRSFKQLLMGHQPRAMAPKESLQALRVKPGFKVALVAQEPLIHSPVAFEWSADGRLWVVEMGDYPNGMDGKGRGGGRVRILEDPDGDGVYDSATTFLDELNFPTGLYPWRNGIVVSAAPDIFYAEDTDGDGKADVREVLFTGFTPGNQQHRVNGFDYGLDGWLYGANGDSGGNVKSVGMAKGGRISGTEKNAGSVNSVSLRNRDFRIHPDQRLIVAIEGQTQFGRHRDDFGNWFGNNNPAWLWHYFFPDQYLARNPFLPIKTTKKMLANYDESTRCYPISRTLSRFNDPFAENHVTSGNSPTPYRDELFGKEFENSVFISEPVHNLVHREVLQPEGVSFTSRRASDEATNEFLASSDNWFRPTMLKTGPDGALYMADMYRRVIEHPEWIPAEMQARLDLRAGADMGRIYRVYPETATPRKTPNIAKLRSTELVDALNSPNGWQRDTAQRLLLERAAVAEAEKLRRLAKEANSAKVRVQALWTLQGLGTLTDLADALNDPDARVREQALRIHGSATAEQILPLASAPSARVRFQAALRIGELNDSRAAATLMTLARDEDENIRNAALSSAPRHAAAMLAIAEKSAPEDRARKTASMLKEILANNSSPKTQANVIERTNTISSAQRAERAKIVARYAGVAKLHGDAKSGGALFKQNCAACHRLRGEGTEVGPDLGMMQGKPVEQIIEAILNPNAAMEERYRSYTLSTKDDRDLTGIIVAETPTTITVRAANQPDQTILRAQLKEFTASGISLMPEGFEGAFNPQQLADVIAFVLGR